MKKQAIEQSVSLVPVEIIQNKIYLIRGRKVMLDRDLAELYGVTTGNLNKAVKRNAERFPSDFMYMLSKEESDSLSFQFGSLKRGEHFKYLPTVFTEQGVAMLSSVLNSDRAIEINIQIMRVFTELREMMASHKDLARKIENLERKFQEKFQDQFLGTLHRAIPCARNGSQNCKTSWQCAIIANSHGKFAIIAHCHDILQ